MARDDQRLGQRPRPFDLDVMAEDGRVDAKKRAGAIDDAHPRRAVKIAHLWALQNRTPVGGQFQNRTL